MVKPCASAIAAIPGKPTPSPTTAAAPAPMKTNEKVPMNSARSLGAIRLDIVDSTEEVDRSTRTGLRQEQFCKGWPAARGGAAAGQRSERASLRGDRLRREVDAQRLRDAGAVFGIRLRAVRDVTLFNFDARVTHGADSILEEKLLLLGGHLPEQDAGLLVVIIIDAMIPISRITMNRQRRLDQCLVPVHPRTLAVWPVVRRRA